MFFSSLKIFVLNLFFFATVATLNACKDAPTQRTLTATRPAAAPSTTPTALPTATSASSTVLSTIAGKWITPCLPSKNTPGKFEIRRSTIDQSTDIAETTLYGDANCTPTLAILRLTLYANYKTTAGLNNLSNMDLTVTKITTAPLDPATLMIYNTQSLCSQTGWLTGQDRDVTTCAQYISLGMNLFTTFLLENGVLFFADTSAAQIGKTANTRPQAIDRSTPHTRQ